MPPKAKKKGGKAKKAKEAAPVSEEQLQHQLLVAEAQRLKDEITRETADINEFQQQRVRCICRCLHCPRSPCSQARTCTHAPRHSCTPARPLRGGWCVGHVQGQLNYFWIVEKKKLEDKRAELRNKERERQDLEEKHQVEIKVARRCVCARAAAPSVC